GNLARIRSDCQELAVGSRGGCPVIDSIPRVPSSNSSTRAPLVSVVIPNWNGQRYLEACFQALRRATMRHFEVILVANGSPDDSVVYTMSRFREVRIERRTRNSGFAGAVNAGIRASSGRYVALLNNDTEADPRWLEELVKAMESAPEVGSAASKMLDF